MTEPLIIFYLFILFALFILYENKKNIFISILMGLGLGLSILVKGNMIFIPFGYFIYAFYLYCRKKEKLHRIVISLLICISIVASWSAYVSNLTNKVSFVSTQTNNILLDGNNEYAKKDGGWHREWAHDPESFYSKHAQYGLITKVLLFYVNKPITGIQVLIKKLNVFGKIGFLLFALFWGLVFEFIELYRNGKTKLLSIYIAVLSVLIILDSYLGTTFSFFLYFVLYFCHSENSKIPDNTMPVFFIVVALNFILLTLILFGYQRFIIVANFVFMLVGINGLLVFIKQYIRNTAFPVPNS